MISEKAASLPNMGELTGVISPRTWVICPRDEHLFRSRPDEISEMMAGQFVTSVSEILYFLIL